MSQLRLDIDTPAAPEPLWERLLGVLEARLGREGVRTWLRPARPLGFESGELTLAAPTATARDWIHRKYAPALESALREITGGEGRVTVIADCGLRIVDCGPDSENSSSDRKSVHGISAPGKVAAPGPLVTRHSSFPIPQPTIRNPQSAIPGTPLNDRYLFDSFVVGGSNRFAHAAATAVAERPGRAYNPLFLYGETGLGKTHLLHAVGHAVRQRNPAARVAYVSGETFTTQFVRSLREGRMEEFKAAYRTADVWLVDDIQFVADKTSSREEFFHTFNDLYLTNRQIVVAADRPPQELRLMDERLRSRLGSGLMAEIVPPELETRMAILERRAAAEGATLDPEVVLTIAQAVEANIRALEAALIRVLALASLNRSPVTADLAAHALEALVHDGRLSGVSLAAVQRAVCQEFGIGETALTAGRDQQSSRARRVAMYLLRELGRHSLAQIGDLFGGKTHSTVVYACQKLEQEMKQDADLAAAVRALSARLGGKAKGKR